MLLLRIIKLAFVDMPYLYLPTKRASAFKVLNLSSLFRNDMTACFPFNHTQLGSFIVF